jgi:hypothetical protein
VAGHPSNGQQERDVVPVMDVDRKAHPMWRGRRWNAGPVAVERAVLKCHASRRIPARTCEETTPLLAGHQLKSPHGTVVNP